MNDIQRTEKRKRRMVERMGGSPFLVFFFDHWFGLFALVFLLLLVFLGLFIPPIWRQTPADFNPVVKVSGLDLWQARSLRKTALEQGASGRVAEAMHSWQAAIGNNPADIRILREGLGFVVSQKSPPKEFLEFTVNHAFWLLRLGGTNTADAELTLNLMTRYEMQDYVVRVGENLEDRLADNSLGLLLRSYFQMGRVRNFAKLWDKHPETFSRDAELQVYRNAWLANWGPAATLQAGREALKAAQADPKLRSLANRLQLQVSNAMRDEATYGQVLRLMEEDHDATLVDHARHWTLINALGRREEARDLARNYPAVPRSPMEVRVLVTTLSSLGLTELSVSILDQQLKTYGFDADLWLTQANNLVTQKQWAELRTLAFSIRNEVGLQGGLDAYSQYLEALAEMNLDRPEAARAAADRLAKSAGTTPELMRYMATQMRGMGFADVSLVLLRGIEAQFKGDSLYWFDRTVAASLANNVDEILPSAEKAFAINPADPSILNNYAAALILTRTRPSEAVQLTFSVVTARPGDTGAELNHVLALLQNDRFEQAADNLRKMNTLSLNLSETALYHLAWFEYAMGKKDWHQARVSYGKIDTRRLLGLQVSRLESRYKSIPEG
jgi:tetratricopeptide (TPR) repeat protein